MTSNISIAGFGEEAHYHFCLMEFEKLLHKHGLSKLLKDMSDDSALTLLNQADAINCLSDGLYINE